MKTKDQKKRRILKPMKRENKPNGLYLSTSLVEKLVEKKADKEGAGRKPYSFIVAWQMDNTEPAGKEEK